MSERFTLPDVILNWALLAEGQSEFHSKQFKLHNFVIYFCAHLPVAHIPTRYVKYVG